MKRKEKNNCIIADNSINIQNRIKELIDYYCRDQVQYEGDACKGQNIDNEKGSNNYYIKLISESLYYSCLDDKAKLLRSNLFLFGVNLFGRQSDTFLDIACAIEMIHCYSISHDDLPCMDNDDYRRGKASLHKRFSEDIALLAGDTLLTIAFGIITNSKSDKINEKIKCDIVSLFVKHIGPGGMIMGQLMDLNLKEKPSLSIIREIHSLKAGSLISMSLQASAICCNQTEEVIETIGRIGMLIGLLLQVVDDINDIEKDEIVNMAKVVGKDAAIKMAIKYRNEISTLLSEIVSLAKIDSNNESEDLQRYALDKIEQLCNLLYKKF